MRSYSPETIGVMTDERQRRCHEDAGAHQLGNRATVRSAICWPCRRTSVPEQSGVAPLHHRRNANGPRRSFNTALLHRAFPGVRIIGLFIARRVPEAVDIEDFDF
jgi:hypothetical protein